MAAHTDNRAPTLRVMLAFELGLGVFGVVLALAFGLTPWLDLHWQGSALLLSLLATVPMVLSLLLIDRTDALWLRELDQLMDEVLVPWFRHMPSWGLFLVALSAGIGEELLFRGVIQAGLDGLLGSIPGLFVASLLFGLVHALNRAYFLIATLAGFYLGLLYLATDNLVVPMVVHFLYDWIALHYYLRRRPRQPTADWDKLEP